MKRLIVFVLIIQMAVLPGAHAAESPADSVPVEFVKDMPESNIIIRLIRQEIERSPRLYYTESELSVERGGENKTEALDGVQKIVSELEDSSVSISSIRQQVVRQVIAEEEANVLELKYLILKMSGETLDRLVEQALSRGLYDPDLKMRYQSAYTLREKQEVVLDLVRTDLFRLKSVTVKRLGLLDREGLLTEMKTTKGLISTKDAEDWQVALLVILAVAAAGFVSWAVVSHTKKAWEKKIRNLEEEYRQKEVDLRNEFANKEIELNAIFQDRARLREEGYVWTVCSTTNTLKSVSCSYDFTSHAGAEVCVTYCLKQPTTGHVATQSTSCSSAFIPSNCFSPNPYTSGYNSGYNSGYDDGYVTGYDRAYYDAYQTYYNKGYDDGYLSGYDMGYNRGFTDGLAEAAYDDQARIAAEAAANSSSSSAESFASFKMIASTPVKPVVDSVALGYKSGYREGYAYATELRLASY